MNKNIKKINSHLWLVNFDHIKAGYIEELKDIIIDENNFSDGTGSTITKEGIMLIHSTGETSKYSDNLTDWMEFLMTLKDGQLKENEAFKAYIAKKYDMKTHQWNDEILKMYVKAGHYENILEFLNHVSGIELLRRQVVINYKREKLSKLNPWEWLERK